MYSFTGANAYSSAAAPCRFSRGGLPNGGSHLFLSQSECSRIKDLVKDKN